MNNWDVVKQAYVNGSDTEQLIIVLLIILVALGIIKD